MEFLAVILTLLCVYLAIKKNIWNWPAGIIAVILYFIIFFEEKLYADMMLQIIFFIQGIYGWIRWKDKSNDDVFVIKKLNTAGVMMYVILTLFLSAGMYFILSTYTDASIPSVDSFVTSLSIVGNILLIYKNVENWYWWIIADIFYVGLFYYKELYFSAILYFILLIMATKGLIEWKKNINMV